MSVGGDSQIHGVSQDDHNGNVTEQRLDPGNGGLGLERIGGQVEQ